MACVAWRFKQFLKQMKRARKKRRRREEPPARITHIFYCRPYYISCQPDERF